MDITQHPRILIEQWSHIKDSSLQQQSFVVYCDQHSDKQVVFLWDTIQQQVHMGGIDARPLLHYIVHYLHQQKQSRSWALYCIAKENHYHHARAIIWPQLWSVSPKPSPQSSSQSSSQSKAEFIPPATDAKNRVLTLGERRALARKPNSKTIQKLIYDADPVVLKHLLNNPRMIEAYILKITHYTHQTTDVLRSIYQHHKWSKRASIQQALFSHSNTPMTIRCILCQDMPISLLKYHLQQTDTPLVLKQEIQRVIGQKINPL